VFSDTITDYSIPYGGTAVHAFNCDLCGPLYRGREYTVVVLDWLATKHVMKVGGSIN